MNKIKADHISKSPTSVPRDAERAGVRSEKISIIIDDKGEKERGSGSDSGAMVDCV